MYWYRATYKGNRWEINENQPKPIEKSENGLWRTRKASETMPNGAGMLSNRCGTV